MIVDDSGLEVIRKSAEATDEGYKLRTFIELLEDTSGTFDLNVNSVSGSDDFDVTNKAGICIQIEGTWTGSILIYGSTDGENFDEWPMYNVTAKTDFLGSSTSCIAVGNIAGLRKMRVFGVATGSATITWRASSFPALNIHDERRRQTILYAAVNVSNSGNNSIVAANASKKIKLLHYTLVADNTVAVKWRSGDTDLTGAMSLAANGGVSGPVGTPAGGWLLETAVNQALNLNLSGAVGVRGHVSYFLEA